MADEEQVVSNIVQAPPVAEGTEVKEGFGNDIPTPSAAADDANYSQKLAQDAIKFMDQEFGSDLNKEFWLAVREECNNRLGETPPTVEPMTAAQYKSFAKEEIPWGKYAGQKVATVAKKDRPSLKKLAVQPLPFQTRLQRFLKTRAPRK